MKWLIKKRSILAFTLVFVSSALAKGSAIWDTRIDPNSASTLGGFITESTQSVYYPRVAGFTGGNCTAELSSMVFDGGEFSFGAGQVTPTTWYLSGNALYYYAGLISPAIDISTITGIKFQDASTGTNSACIPVTYSSSSFTRTAGAGAPEVLSLLYYNTRVLHQGFGFVVATAGKGTDTYLLYSTAATATLVKVSALGVVTTLTTISVTSTSTLKDMYIAGNYLFIIDSTIVSSSKYILRFDITGDFSSYESLAYSSALTLTRMTSNVSDTPSGFTVYINTSNKKLIYFVGDEATFSATTVTTTGVVGTTAFNSIAYRKAGTNNVPYLYGTYGVATYSGSLTRAGKIDEIDISSLPAVTVTVFSIPDETLSPNHIVWANECSKFVISDKFTNGAYSSTHSGRIYKYTPTFDATTGAITSFGAGTLVILGNTTTDGTTLAGGVESSDAAQNLNTVTDMSYFTVSGLIHLIVANKNNLVRFRI